MALAYIAARRKAPAFHIIFEYGKLELSFPHDPDSYLDERRFEQKNAKLLYAEPYDWMCSRWRCAYCLNQDLQN